MSLSGKVAVVTGAGQGIGRGIALRLASEGAAVAVADINPETAAAVSEEALALSARALAITVDISNCAQIPPMVDTVVQRLGGIHIWVNNAGIIHTKAMLELTEEDWDKTLAVNAKGTFFCLQAAARYMVQKGGGLIVNITSGQRARPMAPHYAASKMAVDGITRTAALALAPFHIRVNAIDPGMVETPAWKQMDADRVRMFGLAPGEATRRWVAAIPTGRTTSPEAVGAVVAFLASDHAANITGQIIRLTGGADLETLEKTQHGDRS